MAKINLDKDQFGNLIISYLLDLIINTGELFKDNESIEDLSKLLKNRSFKTHLLKYYMKMPQSERFNYKRIRKSLVSETGPSMLIIFNPKEKGSKILKRTKQLAKKVIKKIVKGE